jgi:hypothetical protein
MRIRIFVHPTHVSSSKLFTGFLLNLVREVYMGNAVA